MKAESPVIRTIELKDRNGRVTGTKEVVTYAGLLSKAHDEGLKFIKTSLVQAPTDDNSRVAIARAEAETSRGTFQGYGDASPENATSFIVPHLTPMPQTPAKPRPLPTPLNIPAAPSHELDA